MSFYFCALRVYHHHNQSQQQNHHHAEHQHSCVAPLLLLVQGFLGRFHDALPLVALYFQARVLNAVHLFHVHQAVALRGSLLVIAQRVAIVVVAFARFVAQHVDVSQVFLRLDGRCHLLCLPQVHFRPLLIAHFLVQLGQPHHRAQRVPRVFRAVCQVVSLLVFVEGLVVLSRLLVEVAKEGVAERYAQRVVGAQVQCHGAAVVHPCRVCLPLFFQYGAYVGIVDGLPHVFLQLRFSAQGYAQRAVGALQVACRQIHVAQPVERCQPVFLGRKRGVGTLPAHRPCLIVVLLRRIEYAHAAVHGADVVQCLHPFQRVAQLLGQFQLFVVHVQRVLKLVFVSQRLSLLPQHVDFSQRVSLAFQLFQQRFRLARAGGLLCGEVCLVAVLLRDAALAGVVAGGKGHGKANEHRWQWCSFALCVVFFKCIHLFPFANI